MENSIFKILVILIIISSHNIAFVNSQQEDEASIIVGYSKSYMFPLLEGGNLYFEKGEELWAMTLDKPTILRLISPAGRVTEYYMEPLKQTLIKSFTEGDEEGQWILRSEKYNLMIELSSKKKLEDNTRLNYRISGGKLTVETANEDQDVFIIDVEDGRFLIPAGVEVDMKLPYFNNTNEQVYTDVVLDLVYPGEFSYSGKLFDRPYSIVMEPLAARIVGKLRGDKLTIVIPNLHKVGAGGIIPVREGEALLKIRYISLMQNGSSSQISDYTPQIGQVKVYIVDEIFNEWAGRNVAKSLSIDVEEALNKTIRVISRSRQRVGISYAFIPLASIVLYEPRLNKIIGNISIIVEGHQATVTNGRGYILLTESESALPIPVNRSSTELTLHVYVNNFKAYNGKIKINRGETYFIPVELRNLRVSIFFPNGTPAYTGILKINDSRMNIINGSASYLLPPDQYTVEFNINEWFGTVTVNLLEDTSIKINLSRNPTILDILKILAGLESATIILLIYLSNKAKKKQTSSFFKARLSPHN